MNVVKIAVVGPQSVGKTLICEYYTEITEKPDFDVYNPTQIVRIYETERKIQGINNPVPVQLYDLSGSQENEQNYSKFSGLVDGVIIVIPAIDLVNLTKIVKRYYNMMVTQEGVGKNNNVIVLLHKAEHPLQDSVYIEDKVLSGIPVYNTCLEDQQEQIFDDIDNLVEKIAKQQLGDMDY